MSEDSVDSPSQILPNDDAQAAYRYADAVTAAAYPLDCQTQPLAFVQDPATAEPERWRLDIQLPSLAAGSLVIPSYTQLGADNYRTQFELLSDSAASVLPWVPSATEVPRTSTAVTRSKLSGVSTHIDYWLISAPTPPLTLRLWLLGAAPSSRYLLKINMRPQQLEHPLPASSFDSQELLGCRQTTQPISQKLGPNKIRGGICSPTATAMAMAQVSPNRWGNWPDLVSACRDGATGLYGVWPLNLYQASRRGYLGAIETPSTGTEVHDILATQLPLVASIQYAQGALPGAPQEQTSGHLVLLHGIQQGNALVSDPAAPNTTTVERLYPLAEFLEAWLRNRGACYLLLPKA